MTVEDYRRFYSEEIEFTANINSPTLIEAFARVPREKFLGPGPWRIASAEQRALATTGLFEVAYVPIDDPRHVYHNVVIVLHADRDVNNGQPSALARWIDALDLKPGNRVYHLGCGVGYYTAIIAEVVGPGGNVVGIEALPDLAGRARENLSGYSNVTVHSGDGTVFDPGECDAMLINAGVTHPNTLWLERLREGGRLVVPFTIAMKPTTGQGIMAKIVRQNKEFSAHVVTPLMILSCSGLRTPEGEERLKNAMRAGKLMKLKSLRIDAHEPEEMCLVHGSGVCLSEAEVGGAGVRAAFTGDSRGT